jgi:hypothetical protein
MHCGLKVLGQDEIKNKDKACAPQLHFKDAKLAIKADENIFFKQHWNENQSSVNNLKEYNIIAIVLPMPNFLCWK